MLYYALLYYASIPVPDMPTQTYEVSLDGFPFSLRLSDGVGRIWENRAEIVSECQDSYLDTPLAL